jgi:hypothetical protein
MTPAATWERRMGHYRWVVCALLFFATTINYADRQILSLVNEQLDHELGWANEQFGGVNSAFQRGLLGCFVAGFDLLRVQAHTHAIPLQTRDQFARHRFVLRVVAKEHVVLKNLLTSKKGVRKRDFFPRKLKFRATGKWDGGRGSDFNHLKIRASR